MKLKKGINTFFRVMLVKVFKKKYPLLLNLRVTNQCNRQCIYCAVPQRSKEQLTKEEIFSIIDEVENECVFINLYGGEPLLREDIGEIIDYINAKDSIFLSLSSNGTLVPSKISDVKKLNLIFLSLDGPKSIHDRQKGDGSFDDVMEAIKVARKNNVQVIVMTAISKFNIHRLDYILEKARELDFNVVFQPVISGAKDNSPVYPDEKEFTDFINRLIKKNDKRLSSMSKCSLRYYLHWPHGKKKRINCLVERISCFIDADGSLFPCTTLCDINYGEAQNREPYNSIRNGGVKEAFNKLNRSYCVDCWAVDSVEINYNPFFRNAIKRMLLGKI